MLTTHFPGLTTFSDLFRTWYKQSTSQELCTRFALRYVLLWFGTTWFNPYSPGLFHWHWGNHMIAPVPVMWPWRIWEKYIKLTHKVLILSPLQNKAQQNHVYSMGYNVYVIIVDTIYLYWPVSPNFWTNKDIITWQSPPIICIIYVSRAL